MSRVSRQVAIGLPHHVTQRGNNRQAVFFDDQDRFTYLHLLSRHARKNQLDVWAYCIMPNHIHLLVVPEDELSLARGVGITTMTYTQYVNRKYQRVGRLWQNRFYSSVVSDEQYLWAVARYIENNPVVANLVGRAEDYEWSSAKDHVLGEQNPYVELAEWLAPEDRNSYMQFVCEYDKPTTEMISQAVNSNQPVC